MAVQHAIGHSGYHSKSRRKPLLDRAQSEHDLAPRFWSIALPACLLFWAALAYGIHSAF